MERIGTQENYGCKGVFFILLIGCTLFGCFHSIQMGYKVVKSHFSIVEQNIFISWLTHLGKKKNTGYVMDNARDM